MKTSLCIRIFVLGFVAAQFSSLVGPSNNIAKASTTLETQGECGPWYAKNNDECNVAGIWGGTRWVRNCTIGSNTCGYKPGGMKKGCVVDSICWNLNPVNFDHPPSYCSNWVKADGVKCSCTETQVKESGPWSSFQCEDTKSHQKWVRSCTMGVPWQVACRG
jgi:hypothetical protein